jgi:hypothetical protein
MKVEDIEEAILKLPPDELAKLRHWFAAFESGMAPPKHAHIGWGDRRKNNRIGAAG